MSLLGTLDFGAGSLHFEEICSTGDSLSVGGDSFTYNMNIGYNELAKFIGNLSFPEVSVKLRLKPPTV